jgi:hypothetical protein
LPPNDSLERYVLEASAAYDDTLTLVLARDGRRREELALVVSVDVNLKLHAIQLKLFTVAELAVTVKPSRHPAAEDEAAETARPRVVIVVAVVPGAASSEAE